MKPSQPKSQKDPICGMDLDPKKAAHKVNLKDRTYYFCGPQCQKVFVEKNPQPASA